MDVSYEIVNELGKGAFAKVYRVRSSATDTLYAAKVAENKTALAEEADIHSNLTHPNILQFVAFLPNATCPPDDIQSHPRGQCAVIISELCTDTTLEQFVRRFPTLSQIRAWGKAIASGLLYLKEQGVVHRDIKPENILFCHDGVKIADFGLAAYERDLLASAGSSFGQIGTPYYMPLEAFTSTFGYFTDVFALGVILYQLYTGRRPYRARDIRVLLNSLQSDATLGPMSRNQRDVGLEDLMLRMLQKRYDLRPTIEEVVQHPFFQEAVDEKEMTMEEFRALKAEFGDTGTREQFYMYLANKNPLEPAMSLATFTDMWNKL